MTPEKPKQVSPKPVPAKKPTEVGNKTPTIVITQDASPKAEAKRPAKVATSQNTKTETALPKRDDNQSNVAIPPEAKQKATPPGPANPEALKWVQKSYESVMRGDAGEAIITASVAITLDSRSVNAYINRSWAYSKKGLYDKAIKDCDKALDIDGENALAYNNRGLAFQGKGDLDRAKADYERACKLGFDIGCNNYQEVVNALASDS